MDGTRAEGSRYQEVNPTTSVSLLKTVKTGNVAGFASDKATDLGVYGLDNPLLTLTMSLLPKPNEEPRPRSPSSSPRERTAPGTPASPASPRSSCWTTNT